MAAIVVYRARFPTAERMCEILKSAGFETEVEQVEPGMQRVFCRRGLEAISAELIDSVQCTSPERPYEFFCSSKPTRDFKGYLVLPSQPGWLFFCFTLQIADLLQKAKFLIDATAKVPKMPSCPQCGMMLRSDKAQQCFHCGADWHEKMK